MTLLKAIFLNVIKTVLIILLLWENANPQTYQYADDPIFSHESGFYATPIQVSINVPPSGAIIHYTLDSSDPIETSPIYSRPIEINMTTVVRARTFAVGYQPSKIISHTYILKTAFTIPTLSVITDPSNLWGENGIHTNYENRGDDWERPATIEFYESDGSLAFSADVGLRIHGGTSRAFSKRSYRYYFRSEYGQNKLHYQLFAPKSIDEVKCFVTLASFQDAPGNSAYGTGTLLRDAVLHEIGRRIEPDISLGTRPVALLLAGKPWGIYNAIERIDRHLLEINFGINDCDIIENSSEAREGTMARWDELIAFFESKNLSLAQNYEIAQSLIDIENFTRYQVVEIYGGNMDWPDYNNIAYRGYNEGDKWKWVLWDLDNAFAYVSANTFELATDDTTRGTIILRKLLDNENYRVYFLNACADFFNSVFQPDNVKSIIDSLAAIIRSDIDYEINSWGGSREEWENSVHFLKNFADQRLNQLWQYILWEFNIEEKYLLTVNMPIGVQGKVRINNIFIAEFPWQGYYFKDIPIELEAMPNLGFKFNCWSDPSLSKEQIITLTMKSDYVINPVFDPDTQKANVIINELNYNSAVDFNPEDWVELYNPTDQSIDLSGWHFKDSDDEHDFKFPNETIIQPKGFFVLCRDKIAFHSLFPDITNCIGDFHFGLSNDGEAVKIYHSSNTLIDSVRYDDIFPWSVTADGNGSTLELIDAKLDNSLPENWRASPGHGSPGMPNRYPPEVISFVVKSKNASTDCTSSRDVKIEMNENDLDGLIVKWLINESPDSPTPEDFALTARPTNYYIKGEEGVVTIYGWVLDNDRQVSRLTDKSHANIELKLLDPSTLKPHLECQSCVRQDVILSNYPNPFNDKTRISYRLSTPSPVLIQVYNMMGEKIKTLCDEWKTGGSYQLSWDGRNEKDLLVPSGLYLVRMKSDSYEQAIKIIMAK